MKNNIFLCLLIVVFLTNSIYSQKTYHFSKKKSLNSGNCDLAIKLDIKERELEHNKRYTVEYIIYNKGISCYLYNPFFNGLIQSPAQLVLYDADKKYIVDLIEFTAGSRRGIEKNDFVVLPNKSKIGGKLSFIAGKTAWGQEIANSKDRKYYLQLVFHKGFLSSHSEIIPKNKNEMPEFYKTFMKKECCRSNIIKLRINKDKTNK